MSNSLFIIRILRPILTFPLKFLSRIILSADDKPIFKYDATSFRARYSDSNSIHLFPINDMLYFLPALEYRHNAKIPPFATKYITIPDDYRLSIDRNSIAFKSVYALRTEAERYNSRFKQAGCERLFVRSGNSVKNLNTIAHISLLSIAIAAVVTKKEVSYRSAKTLKRLA